MHSHLQTPNPSGTWLQTSTTGSYPCGGCSFCKFLPRKKTFTEFTIKQFINCKTMGVIYAAKCTCPKLYIGKTVQQLRRRISKHLSAINTHADTPLARHIHYYHDGDIEALQFWGICHLKLGLRRGNLDKKTAAGRG